jgi:hypothetical protein
MQAEVKGFDGSDGEADRREVLADSLRQRAADPVLVEAVMAPEAAPPAVTRLGARNIYLRERLKDVEKGNDYDRLKRVSHCIAEILRKLAEIGPAPFEVRRIAEIDGGPVPDDTHTARATLLEREGPLSGPRF